ncbi:Zinc finger, CCHC-type, partial [Trema orientale]
MTDVLRAKQEKMETAYAIIESLQAMFGQQSDQSHYDAIRKAINAKMKRGTPVIDHVLNIVNYFGEAKVHGVMIDDRTQVSMILESLSPDFLQFKSNYVMNKLNYTITQLFNKLQTFESISKDKGKDSSATVAEANVTEENSSTSNKNKKKKNKSASRSKPKKSKKGNRSTKKNNSKDKKPKGKYFHCGVEGHWKRNCNKYLSELKEKKK